MSFGHVGLRGIERRLSNFGVRVIDSEEQSIQPTAWNFDLLSPFWRLYSVSEAGAWITWRDGRTDLLPRRLCLIPAWVPFTTGTGRELLQNYVHFTIDGFPAAVLRAQFDRPIDVAEDVEIAAVARKWREAHAAKSIHPTGWRHQVWAGAVVQVALAKMLEEGGADGTDELDRWLAGEPVVQPALDLIEQRLEHPPANAELARACKLSVDHFIRRFRAGTGLTPTQYCLERRVMAASRLLAETDRKIEDIAEATGFNDRFYFSRVFRARLRVTPAVYRRVHRRERLSGIG